jgi:hypothetical protein
MSHGLPPEVLAQLAQLGAKLELLDALATVHRTLWDLEDLARSRQASFEEITQVKRAIDTHNGQRHALIDGFDASFSPPSPSDTALLSSETVGELSDRLIILGLKIHNTRVQLADPSLPVEAVERCRAALGRLQRWQAHLLQCLSNLVRAVAAGTVILPPRREFKLYNDPVLNPVVRREAPLFLGMVDPS